jgi:hypothetical protein
VNVGERPSDDKSLLTDMIDRVLGLAMLLASALLAPTAGAEPAVRFLAIGDVPYSESEYDLLAALLETELRRSPAFLVHVGDIKSGSAPCTDQAFARIADLFQSLPVPVLYTPGDNEWTDCHRRRAGGFDPRERLTRLRQIFYDEGPVLRLDQLGAEANDPSYPENYYLLVNGVLFAAVHLVGSHNNLTPGKEASLTEHLERSEANRAHLERIAAVAKAEDATSLVLLFHANPGFEASSPPRGYGPFAESLASLLRQFQGPVLAVHGDTHRFRFDQPLRDPGHGGVLRRFFRLEVPGSPMVAGVRVGVDPTADQPFAVELAPADARERLIVE